MRSPVRKSGSARPAPMRRMKCRAIGAGTSLFTGRGLLFSGARQLLIGYAAAGVTFAIGRLVGVSLGG